MTTIIFDLDGTLIDTAPLVLPVFREILGEIPGAPNHSDNNLKKTFGMPEPEIWKFLLPAADSRQRYTAYKLAEQKIQEAMYNQDVLLPHARDVLSEFRKRGHRLTVASNCGTGYLEAVLDSQGIRALFTDPLCLESVNGTQKADILARHFLHVPPAEAVMVGDRSSDVEAAHAHHIPCIGCAFGFGPKQELLNADTIIHALPELLPIFPAESSPLLVPHGRG